MDSIIKSVLDGDWTELKSYFEKRAASKVMDKVNDKKVGILAKINDVEVDEMKKVMGK